MSNALEYVKRYTKSLEIEPGVLMHGLLYAGLRSLICFLKLLSFGWL